MLRLLAFTSDWLTICAFFKKLFSNISVLFPSRFFKLFDFVDIFLCFVQAKKIGRWLYEVLQKEQKVFVRHVRAFCEPFSWQECIIKQSKQRAETQVYSLLKVTFCFTLSKVALYRIYSAIFCACFCSTKKNTQGVSIVCRLTGCVVLGCHQGQTHCGCPT